MDNSSDRMAMLHLADALLYVVTALDRVKRDAVDQSKSVLTSSFDEDLRHARASLKAMLEGMGMDRK